MNTEVKIIWTDESGYAQIARVSSEEAHAFTNALKTLGLKKPLVVRKDKQHD